jgi:hypothetical protein
LTALLVAFAPTDLPTLVARHPRRDWMILADGGRKVRDVFHGRDLLREWARVLPRYAEIQIALLGRERQLRATGTPDLRLERIPSVVERMLADEGTIRRPGYDLVSAQDEGRVRAALAVVAERCAELADLGIGPSIDHSDLHDANVLIRRGRTVVFDWGDAYVTHPFLSLQVALRFAAMRARTSVHDARIVRLRDAYLEPFSRFAPAPRLRRAGEIGRRLGVIARAASWYRVVTLTPMAPDEGGVGGDSMAEWLRRIPRAFPRRRS